MELKKTQVLEKNQQARFPYDHSFAISNRGDLLISYAQYAKANLINLTTLPLVHETLHFHTFPIYTSCFSPHGELLAMGGEDGKVFLYDLQYKKCFSPFDKRPDYISNIEFSTNSRYITMSSFNNVTEIFDLEKHESIGHFSTSSTIECSVFTPSLILYTVGRNGEVYAWNVQTQVLSKLNVEILGWPTQVILMGEDHLLIATRSNHITLYNHKMSQVVREILVTKSGITQMALRDSFLMICFVDGEIQIINTEAFVEEFSIHLHLKEYENAFLSIEKNIFLVTLPIIELFHKGWSEQLEQAKSHLMKHELKEANKTILPFMFHQQYKTEWESHLFNARLYTQFYVNVHSGNIIIAFKLAELYPFLLKTDEYNIIEAQWLKLYKKAKQLFRQNTIASIDEAKKQLEPYLQIPSKKDLIYKLEQNYSQFLDSDKLIRERDFKSYFLLVEKYPFLKLEEVFKKVLEIGDRTFVRMLMYEAEGELDEALKISTYLLDFIPMRPLVKEAIEVIESKKMLQKAILHEDIQKVYFLIDKHPEFAILPYFIEFHTLFLNLIAKAEPYATDGKIEILIKLLSDYLYIPYTQARVAALFRHAYIQELRYEKKIGIRIVDWTMTLHLFCSYFGLHSDLLVYVDELELSSEIDNIDPFSYLANGYSHQTYPLTMIIVQAD